MSYDFHPLWLSDAIVSDERVALQWSDTGLPERVEKLLATAEQVADSLSGIVGLLEADEALVAADNQGTFDYCGLPPRTRFQLFQACRHLSSYLVNEMAEVAGVEFKRGAT